MEKLRYKYPRAEIDAMLDFMQQNMFQKLPLSDFAGNSIVWAPSMLTAMDFNLVRRLMTLQPGNEPFGVQAMEEEIYATRTIESINISRDSIRRILNGYAPQSEDETRIHGMKRCMARLLHLWYLVQKGYSSALFIPFSKFVNASRTDYYRAYSLVEENSVVSGVTDVTPFADYFIRKIYNELEKTGPAIGTETIYDNALRERMITEKEKELWIYVLSHYGMEPFSTKQLELDSRLAAYATIRGFVLKFEQLGLLQVQRYRNRNKYQIAKQNGVP